MDLSMVYVVHAMLVGVKKEMDEKGLTFDEFLKHYDEGIKLMEKAQEQSV